MWSSRALSPHAFPISIPLGIYPLPKQLARMLSPPRQHPIGIHADELSACAILNLNHSHPPPSAL
jgi:hypothetical protein